MSNFCCSWCLSNGVNYYDDLGTKYAECQKCGNLYSWDDNFHEWRLEEVGASWKKEEC